jgi:hypothetical protein
MGGGGGRRVFFSFHVGGFDQGLPHIFSHATDSSVKLTLCFDGLDELDFPTAPILSNPRLDLEWRVGLSLGDQFRDGPSVYTYLGLDHMDRMVFHDSEEGDEFTRPVGCEWIASLPPVRS